MADETASPGPAADLVGRYADTQVDQILGAVGALADRADDAVHPTRVATRRLRATLRTFRGVYEPGAAATLADDLRWFARLLGGVRDLEVIGDRVLSEVPDPCAQRWMRDRLASERTEAWGAVDAALAGERGERLLRALACWRDDPPWGPKADRGRGWVAGRVRTADRRLARRLDTALAAAKAGDSAAPDLMHRARKAAKAHRYALELAQDVVAGAGEAIASRRELQDLLGGHQDAVALEAWLGRAAAAEPDATIARPLERLAVRVKDGDAAPPTDAVRQWLHENGE